MELSGAEIVVRCLQDEGVKHVFGYPGGAVLFIYDEIFKQDKFLHILVRHEQAAVHAADAYSRSSNRIGVALVTSGPGRDQRGHRHRDRVHGLDSDGHLDRAGADARDRTRRLPGMRHGRHHAPLRQAQLPGQRRARTRWSDQEGVLYRAKWPARSGAGRHPQGRDGGALRVRIPARSLDAFVQAGGKGPFRPDQESSAVTAVRRAADGLHRRWGDPGERCRSVESLRQPARISVHQYVDGARCIRGQQREVCRHARHARDVRSEHGDAALRRADCDRCTFRRSGDRQPETLLDQPAQDHSYRRRPVVDLEAREG